MDAPRAVAALLLLAVALPVAAAGCGDSGPAREQLEWLDTPNVVVPPALADDDRILRGDVRNDSGDDLRLESDKVRVYDNKGRRLKASATFAAGYLHSLYPPTRGPESLPDSELARLGKIAQIKAGDTAQITVSWREPRGVRTAERIDYGSGSLRIPPEAKDRRDRNF